MIINQLINFHCNEKYIFTTWKTYGSSDNIVSEVRDLNTKVIEFCVGKITTQVTQYEGYLDRLKTLPIPIEHPRQVDRNNYTYDISNLLN